jgi:hypothetical protein
MLNYLKDFLPLIAVDFDKNGPIISVKPENLLFVLKSLKLHTNTQYSLLTAVSGVDYPFRKRRFEVVYDLLSVKFNSRIRVKTFVDEVTPLTSAVSVFPAATWWEREVWDLYGVFFLISGFILFVGMLGAIMLTLSLQKSVKKQIVYKQLSRHSENAFVTQIDN